MSDATTRWLSKNPKHWVHYDPVLRYFRVLCELEICEEELRWVSWEFGRLINRLTNEPCYIERELSDEKGLMFAEHGDVTDNQQLPDNDENR